MKMTYLMLLLINYSTICIHTYVGHYYNYVYIAMVTYCTGKITAIIPKEEVPT